MSRTVIVRRISSVPVRNTHGRVLVVGNQVVLTKAERRTVRRAGYESHWRKSTAIDVVLVKIETSIPGADSRGGTARPGRSHAATALSLIWVRALPADPGDHPGTTRNAAD